MLENTTLSHIFTFKKICLTATTIVTLQYLS